MQVVLAVVASVENDDGYWRSAFDSENLRRCRYQKFCKATALWVDLDEPRDPDAQCRKRHSGPLCSLCEKSNLTRRLELDPSDGKCRECGGRKG